MALLGQSSGWTQTYLGATDLDTEGTWTWIKTGGSTFWEGGDPASGGAAVSGMFANFLDGEPNNGGGGNSQSQNCLVIAVNLLLCSYISAISISLYQKKKRRYFV